MTGTASTSNLSQVYETFCYHGHYLAVKALSGLRQKIPGYLSDPCSISNYKPDTPGYTKIMARAIIFSIFKPVRNIE
jgi:hypothetical protein